jgi:hypothetical protein
MLDKMAGVTLTQFRKDLLALVTRANTHLALASELKMIAVIELMYEEDMVLAKCLAEHGSTSPIRVNDNTVFVATTKEDEFKVVGGSASMVIKTKRTVIHGMLSGFFCSIYFGTSAIDNAVADYIMLGNTVHMTMSMPRLKHVNGMSQVQLYNNNYKIRL